MIERTDDGGIATLRLAHGKASAMDVELLDAIIAAVQTASTDASRAVVLTGSGRIFSAGVDLNRILDGGAAYAEAFLPRLVKSFEVLFACPKPVVAAVNGHAIAGGCILVGAADYAVMATGGGRIGIPELLVGVPFPVNALEIMRFRLPASSLQAAVYTGGTYEAEEAQRRGFVDEVTDPDVLAGRATKLAAGMAKLAPDLFAATKREVRGPTLERIARRSPERDPEVLAGWKSDAVLGAIRGYVERTMKRSK